jgi:hypothetical protein
LEGYALGLAALTATSSSVEIAARGVPIMAAKSTKESTKTGKKH